MTVYKIAEDYAKITVTVYKSIGDSASIVERACGNDGLRVEPTWSWARAGERRESAHLARCGGF